MQIFTCNLALCFVLSGLSLGGFSNLALAEELERIDPAGISGSLLFAGDQLKGEELVDVLYQLGGTKKANVVLVECDQEKSTLARVAEIHELLAEEECASLVTIALKTDEAFDPDTIKQLEKASVIFIAGDSETTIPNTIIESLRNCLNRKGVVGASEKLAPLLATQRSLPNGLLETKGCLKLLPDVCGEFVSGDAKASSSLQAALANQTTVAGITMSSNGGLIVRGRRLHPLGEGGISILLPKSNHSDEKVVRLSDYRDQADLTALRNSLRDRSGEPFPSSKPGKPIVENGTLIIIGGGGMPRGSIEQFVKLAGGKDAKVIVLPTANGDPISPRQGIATMFEKAGAGEVIVLPQRTFADVESEEYLAKMRGATGIWFGGGRQWRFADAYLDTQALELMHDVLKRGGVIMGSSAGASIQGDYLARANPLGNLDIMADGYERGLNFLPGTAIDQHFKQRRRFADMTSLIKRYPQFLGIGIDESTAIVVEKNIATVIGRGGVHFYDANMEEAEKDYVTVKEKGRYDLAARKVLTEGEE